VSKNGSGANGRSGVSPAESAGASGPGLDGVRHQIHLAGGRHAVPGARAAVDLLTVEHFDELACDDIRLMVSELVANSVRHGGAPTRDDDIEMVVLVAEALLRVECSDPLAGFDAPEAPAGYGLEIIEQLSSAWGSRHGALGATWFEYAAAG
jgi:anti-sigma regulatory factor (Ser/Thr protein kinase)